MRAHAHTQSKPSNIRLFHTHEMAQPRPTKFKGSIQELLKSPSVSGVRDVDFSRTISGVGDLEQIAAVLLATPSIRTVVIADNDKNVGSDGAMILAGPLLDNKSIITLELAFNSLGSGVRSLAGALDNDRTLLYLGLSGNDINSDDMKYICAMLVGNTTLEHVDLSNNHITKRGIGYAIEMMETNKLVKLDLSQSDYADRKPNRIRSMHAELEEDIRHRLTLF